MSLSGKSNVNPQIWGPYFWETIHFTAYGYPENPTDIDKKTYHDFYENMMKILPCDKCTQSAQELFQKLNIDNFLNSKNDLIKWTYLFHKGVNDKLNKDSPTLEEFMYNFTNRSQKESIFSQNTAIIFAILFIIIVLIMLHTLNNP
tara:strand:- start:385 stop:822 length:438 start_codon:yes stop_codon:yes gene_type:complete